MPAGRPLKYKTPEELEEAIQGYFEQNPFYPTVSGLSLHLGFADRSSMYNYKDREEFSHTIKKAILKIESLHEANLFSNSVAGSIFWLKNHNWIDKQINEHQGSLFDALKEKHPDEPDNQEG